jgi:hypothetical protein
LKADLNIAFTIEYIYDLQMNNRRPISEYLLNHLDVMKL